MTALEEGNLVEMFGSGKNLFADFFKREATPTDTECSEKNCGLFFQELLEFFNLSLPRKHWTAIGRLIGVTVHSDYVESFGNISWSDMKASYNILFIKYLKELEIKFLINTVFCND